MEEPIDPVIRSEPVATTLPARASDGAPAATSSAAAAAAARPVRVRALEAALLAAALLSLAAFAYRLAAGPFAFELGPVRVGVTYPSAPVALALGFLAAALVTRARAAGHEAVIRVPSLVLTLFALAAVTIPELRKVDLAVVYLVALLFGIEGVVRGAFPVRRTPLDLPIALFLGSQILTAVVADPAGNSLGEFLSGTLPPVILLYAVYEHGRRSPAATKAVIGAIVLSVVVLLATGYRRYFATSESFFIANLGWYTRTGRFLNLTLPLLAALALHRGGSIRLRLGAAGLVVASAVALLLTQSRGAWAGAVASFAFLGVFLDRRILLVLAGSLLLTLAAAPQRLVDHARSMFDFARFDQSSTVSPLKYRPAAWSYAVDSIADKPLLGHGLGAKGFRDGFVETVAPPPNHGISNAHNVFLEVTYESGLAGLAAFLALLAAVFHRGFKVRAIRARAPSGSPLAARFPLAIVSLAALVGVLVHGLVSHVTHDALAGLFFAQCALVLLDSPEGEA